MSIAQIAGGATPAAEQRWQHCSFERTDTEYAGTGNGNVNDAPYL